MDKPVSSHRGHRLYGGLRTRLLLGIIVGGLAMPPHMAAAQMPAVSDTEMLFWKSVVERDAQAEYGAYLRLFPSGPFAELARARGGDPASAGESKGASIQQTLTMAVARHRLMALSTSIEVQDINAGEACSLAAGAVVTLQEVPAETDTAVRLRVVTSKRGDCPAAAIIDAAHGDVADLLATLLATEPASKARAEATAAERLFWQSIAGTHRAADYQAYLKTYPDGPFTVLASMRAAELVAPQAAAAPTREEQQQTAEDAAWAGTQETETALALKQAQWMLIQRSLAALGYALGAPDGMPGERTRQAIRQFQQKQTLPETGYFGQQQFAGLIELAREPVAREARERAAVTAAAEQDRLRSTPAGPALIGRFGDWTAATHQESGETVCYAFTRVQNSTPAVPGRGAVILTVTERSLGRDAVAIETGFPYSPAIMTVRVNQTELPFYTSQRNAFARDGKGAVAAFSQSGQAFATSPAQNDTNVMDMYSLKGFGPAYAAIVRLCPAR